MQQQQRKIIRVSILTLVMVALLAVAATLAVLYRAAYQTHSDNLRSSADSIAQLLSLSISTDRSVLTPDDIEQLISSHHLDEGLGSTAEIIIIRRQGDTVELQPATLRGEKRAFSPSKTMGIELMAQRALQRESGIGSDTTLDGHAVLAATHSIPELQSAVMVRMHLSELRQPFYAAALGSSTIIVLILFIVPIFYTRLIAPLFDKFNDEKERYRALVELSPYGVLVIDAESGMIVNCNRVAHEQLGYTEEEFYRLHIPDFEVIESPDEVQAHIRKILDTGQDDFDTIHRTKSGERRNVHVHVKTFMFGGRLSFHTIFRDITEQKRAEEVLQHYQNHLEDLVEERNRELIATNQQLRLAEIVYRNTLEGVFVTDASGTILSVNPAFSRITGYSSNEAIGQNPRMLRSHHQPAEFYKAMWDTLLATGQWSGEIWNRRKNGEAYLQQLTITMHPGADGKPLNYVSVFTDITALRESEERIRHQAYHDALTGLPNRILFQDRLGQSLLLAARTKRPLAVLFLDLDRFKVINDTLGHHIGDELLRMVAKRLSSLLRQSDTISRFGGDEFVILIPEIEDINDVEDILEKIISSFQTAFAIEAHDLVITTSIGVALHPEDGTDAAALMRNADAAMYNAKESGRNTYKFYRSDMNAHAAHHLAIENRLRKAVDNKAFELHYQPRVDMASGSIIGVEALIRWNDPEHGMIPPIDFIPVAEESGIIVPIGQWVLERACEQARAWHAMGYPLRVSVNISARQFSHALLVDTIDGLLRTCGLPASLLELELTESLIMSHAEQSIDTLNQLKSLGVSIAIDDFGTGYSSLNYLKRFPIDVLKIDKSFVNDIAADSNDAAIVETIIALGKSLKLEVLAEGVETYEQLDFLHRRGCNSIQGYYFSKPLPADQLTLLLKQNRRLHY